MAIAICFSGQPRSLVHTQENLKKTFHNAFGDDYDIYAYVPVCDTSDQVKRYFPQAEVKVVPDSRIDDSRIPQHRFKTGTQAYLQQINGWKGANTMRKQSGKQYDYVIRCRMDILFTTDIPSVDQLNPHVIYIPDFHHYGGVNDRFCIASPDLIDNYCDIIDIYRKHPTLCTHAETFLRVCLEMKNTPVHFNQVKFDRIRQDGTRIDDTNSVHGANKLYPEHLIVKQP